MKMDAMSIGAFGTLVIRYDPHDHWKVARMINDFKPGNYEIKKEKKKRSLDANAYCWVLANEIGEVLRISAEEVYRNAIREGNAFISVRIPNGMAQKQIDMWSKNGIGWFSVVTDKDNEYTYINQYYGSSQYDTKSMAALIDVLVQECNTLGLETRSKEDVESMLRQFDAK